MIYHNYYKQFEAFEIVFLQILAIDDLPVNIQINRA